MKVSRHHKINVSIFPLIYFYKSIKYEQVHKENPTLLEPPDSRAASFGYYLNFFQKKLFMVTQHATRSLVFGKIVQFWNDYEFMCVK